MAQELKEGRFNALVVVTFIALAAVVFMVFSSLIPEDQFAQMPRTNMFSDYVMQENGTQSSRIAAAKPARESVNQSECK